MASRVSFSCHNGSVNAVSRLGSDPTFVSGGSDGAIYRFAVGEGAPSRVGTVDGAISALYPLPLSDQLLVGLERGLLVVVSLGGGGGDSILEFHNDPVSDIGGSAGLDGILTASYDGTIGIWNADEWRLQERLANDALAPVTALAVDTQGQWFVTGGVNTPLRVWSTESNQPIRAFGDSLEAIVDLAVAPSGDTLLSLDYGGSLEMWDSELWTSRIHLDADTEGEASIAVHPRTSHVAVGKEEAVSIYGFEGDISAHFDVGTARVACLDFSSDGRTLAVGCEDGRVNTLEIDL